jgi:hypothetical protein
VTYNFGCLKPVSIRYRRPNTENKDAMFEAWIIEHTRQNKRFSFLISIVILSSFMMDIETLCPE